MNKQRLTAFRDGIFNLQTRQFGTFAELMIQKLYGFSDSNSKFYDKINYKTGEKIEIKFSRAVAKKDVTINVENIIQQCIEAKNLQNRIIKYFEILQRQFDCNIQQIKPDEFDILYYGIFFLDKIEIFKTRSNNLIPNIFVGYSDKQHKGNIGEGQFHINNKTIKFHRTNFLEKILTYQELFNLFDMSD